MARIENPTSSENIGSFNNIAYSRYKGRFVGTTQAGGNFSVPYEITTPTNPIEGSRTFVAEPPHFSGGPVARDLYMGPGFLWKRGFSHVSVGYSNVNLRILNRNPAFQLMIKSKVITEFLPFPGAGEITDDNIFRQLALTLKQNPPPFVGVVQRIYGIGFSDSGNAVNRMYALFGRNLFDVSFPCTADFLEPVQGEGRIIVFNTEADFDVGTARTAASTAFQNYRWYTLAGGPHIPDTPCARMFFHDRLNPRNPAPPVEGTTPLDWTPFIRALFVAGDKWVRESKEPSRSLVLKVNPGNLIANDEIGNAIGGIRHPALSLKEATFIASIIRVRVTEPVGNARGWALFGAYSRPKRLADILDYATLFRNFTNGLVGAGLLLPDDRDEFIKRALLPPPPGGQAGTYTINYMRKQFPSPTPTSDECGTTSPVAGRDEETFEPTPIALMFDEKLS